MLVDACRRSCALHGRSSQGVLAAAVLVHRQHNHHRRRLLPQRSIAAAAALPPAGGGAGGGRDSADDGGSGSTPDIDSIASFLTQQAAAMRASLDEADLLPAAEDEEQQQPGPDSSSSSSSSSNASDIISSLDSLLGSSSSSGDEAAALASADAAVPAGAALPGGSAPLLNTMDAWDEEGGFLAQDFAIVKLLGRLAVQDVALLSPGASPLASPLASLDGSSSDSDSSSAAGDGAPNIFVYAARYNSGLPYEGPVTVQLREYLPGSRRVAINELLLQQRLCGSLPTAKWQAAAADPNPSPPVVRLLGYLTAPPSDEAFEATGDASDTIWMVYRFEALRPMSLMLAQMDLPEEPPRAGLSSLFVSKEAAVAAALAARRGLLVALARGLLSAVSFCHQRGVAHCGISAGCCMVNSWADKDVGRLLVKLDNFGLARLYPQPLEVLPGDAGLAQLAAFAAAAEDGGGSGGGGSALALEDTDASLQRQGDLQAAALLLVQVFLGGCGAGGGSRALAETGALKRLLFDVFHEDVGLFKEYCLQEEGGGCEAFVEFMDADEGAGWELLSTLMAGKTAAGEVLRTSRLLTAEPSQQRQV